MLKGERVMKRWLTILFLLSFSGWTACSSDSGDAGQPEETGRPHQAALTQFGSCDELESYLEEIALQETNQMVGGDVYWGLPEMGIPRDLLSDDDDSAEGGGNLPPSPQDGATAGDDDNKGSEFTDTNNQEAGVDEADIVKTDGSYLYILTGGRLTVVEATPPEALAQTASVEIEGSPLEMFVQGDTAVVFSATGGWYGGPEPMPMDDRGGVALDSPLPGEYQPARLKVTVLDLGDRTGLTVARETFFEGDYQSSRRVGSRVHLVLNSYLQGPALEYYVEIVDMPPYPEMEDCERPFWLAWEACNYRGGDDGDWTNDDDSAVGDEPKPTDVIGTANSGGAGADPSVISPNPGPDGECDWSQMELALQQFYASPEYQACNARNNARMEPWQEEYNRKYEEAYAAMLERNRDKIEAATLADWLPEMEDDGANGYILGCERFYKPDYASGRGVISVVTLDLEDIAAGWDGSAVVANPGIVYASSEALYLSSYSFNYWMWYGDFAEPPAEVSRIHKFDITGPVAQYAASGEVAGQPLNQFALSEFEGALRVATHTQPVWRNDGTVTDDDDVSPPEGGGGSVSPDGTTTVDSRPMAASAWDDSVANNHLVVLEQVGDDLGVVGEINGIAPGETIYAARFLGAKGFMVTFRQIDPLFTFDLSDPTHPTRVGELKVPGFSTYLHDIGDDRLLAIGEAIDEEGVVRQGLQLSIFDVSDFDQPALEHKLLIGEGYSEASYNHKAFTYFASKGVLAIPLSTYGVIAWGPEGMPIENGDYFTGAAVYDISIADGISERGRVDHTDFLTGEDAYWYGNAVRRTVMIDEAIYTISDLGVKANDLENLDDTLGMVTLPHSPPPPYYGGCYDDVCWEGDKPMIDEP